MNVRKWKGPECVHHITSPQSGVILICICPRFFSEKGHLEDVYRGKSMIIIHLLGISKTISVVNHLDPSLVFSQGHL